MVLLCGGTQTTHINVSTLFRHKESLSNFDGNFRLGEGAESFGNREMV